MQGNNATDDATDDAPSFELKKAEYDESDGWGFVADVRVGLHNPDGEDVGILHTYKHGPKHDDMVSDEQAVHQTTRWWFSGDRPADGDGPFYEQSHSWGHFEDPDHDALLEECVNDNALYDPEMELDALRQNVFGRAKRRLTGDLEVSDE